MDAESDPNGDAERAGTKRMWFYLFGQNGRYPDPSFEIKALAELSISGKDVYLNLSSRNDAPLKNAEVGETLYLCTRVRGQWLVHGETILTGVSVRGEVPESMSGLYSSSDSKHSWRPLGAVRIHASPKSEVDLGLPEGTLPATGQAHVVHVQSPQMPEHEREPQSATSALDRLTEVMDEAWDAGRLTPEAIEKAITGFRKAHPYGR
jgi:hypothetical protein